MKRTTSRSAARDHRSSSRRAVFGCDVGKEKIHVFTKLRRREVVRVIRNGTRTLEQGLKELVARARRAGFRRFLVAAEPSDAYHDTLLRTARRLGLETTWVSAEAVAKFRVIESNDSGKTDHKDPRVIHTLATMGKTLQHRPLEEPYCLLRHWNVLYDAAEARMVEAKGAPHDVLRRLFPDFDFTSDFLFGRSGRALIRRYGANPARIVRSGPKRFAAVMRREAKGIRRRSIERLFAQAQDSVRNPLPPRQAELFEVHLQQLFEDLDFYERRRAEAAEALEALYDEARQLDPCLPKAHPGIVSHLHLARIVGETGPLEDFDSWRRLLRYAGFNLRERASGQYRGQTRLSKKGRTRLRKILGYVVLPLVKKDALYGPLYHGKKQTMPGSKAMTVVARHFLKMIWGCYRSGGHFVESRIFVCESQFPQAA